MKVDFAAKRVRRFFLKHKRVPTYEEMTELFGFSSKNASYYMVNKLIEAGLLGKEKGGRLYLKNLFAIPFAGNIKAGYPATAYSTDTESLNVLDFISDATGDCMFLKVSGDSMKDAAIVEGDYVVIDRNKEAKPGDIVCALVDGEWTLKFFQVIKGRTALVPANDNYPTIYPEQDLTIGGGYGGVVTLVLRKPRP